MITDEIFDIPADEREGYWEACHFEKFGVFAKAARQDIYDQVYVKGKEAVKKGLQTAYGTAANEVTRYVIAKGVVESTTKYTVDAAGRRGAVVAIGGATNTLSAGRGAWAAINGVRLVAVAPAISATLGQLVAEFAAKEVGITNFYAIKGLGMAGAAAGGAAAGAVLGGPVGAAAGAAIGATGMAVGELITAIAWTGLGVSGPNDNWCYLETSDTLPDGWVLKFGTYGPDDGYRIKTYWNETKKKNEAWVMSAGQPQDGHFYLSVWNGHNTNILNIERVFFRDVVRVRYNRGMNKFEFILCKSGLWGDDAGKTQYWSKST